MQKNTAKATTQVWPSFAQRKTMKLWGISISTSMCGSGSDETQMTQIKHGNGLMKRTMCTPTGKMVMIPVIPTLTVISVSFLQSSRVSHSTPTRKKGYKLYQTTYTQHDSEQYCKNQSMEIATITSEEEQEEFDAIASPTSWIGLKRKDENSPWKWTNGDPVPLVKHTHTGECVKLSSKTWEAVNCSTKKNFLCYEGELKPVQ
uniref:C-type lectin domain-containing protein n=1 Tax=Myripristis murdjan TaxID=586833 RepID=A0A667ZX51_9TELE